MTLLLHCTLCGRKQADGLLSRNAWGHLSLEDGNVLRACSSCKGQYSDWDIRLRATVSTNVLLDCLTRVSKRPGSAV